MDSEDIETMQGALWAIRTLIKSSKPGSVDPCDGLGILLTQQRLRNRLDSLGAEHDLSKP